jgi:hypothetical protein
MFGPFFVSEIQKSGLNVNVTNVLRGSRERVAGMVEVSVEVSVNGAPLRLSVRAANIRRAMEMVEARYSPGDIRVVFPIQPDSFFSGAPGSRAERIALESSEVAA